MSDDEFNESCAKAMGWALGYPFGKNYRPMYKHPKLGYLKDEQLRFHDDYNWSYSMMQKCFDKGIVTKAHNRINKNGMMDRAFSDEKDAPKQPEIPSAKQISLACLEVLNEHK